MNHKRKLSTTRTSKSMQPSPPMTTNHSNPSMFSTIKETVVAGFGLGVGSEIAHRVVSSVLGPRTISVVNENTQNSDTRCKEQLENYEKCLKRDNCLDELETYQTCVKKYI